MLLQILSFLLSFPTLPCVAFSLPPVSYIHHDNRSIVSCSRRRTVCLASSFGEGAQDEDDDTSSESSSFSSFDMKTLQDRMNQVQNRGTILPILILDTILPRQVLKIEVANDPVFSALVKQLIQDENPYFGMIGTARLAGTGQDLPLQNGCQVQLVDAPTLVDTGLRVTLRATARRFRIHAAGELTTSAGGGWTEARVTFLDSQTQEAAEEEAHLHRARVAAQKFTTPDAVTGETLVDQWVCLAKTKERQVGQIEQLLQDLGPPPNADTEPSELAFWIGALVNPLPGMGGK